MVYKYNNSSHWQVCTKCNEKFDSYSHSLSYRDAGDSGHYKKCYCGYSTTVVAHTYGTEEASAAGGTVKTCTACGHKDILTKQAETTTTVSDIIKEAGVTEDKATDESGKEIAVKKTNGTVLMTTENIAAETTPSIAEGETATTTVSFPAGALKIKEDAEEVKLTVITASVSVASLNNSGYQITKDEGSTIDTSKAVVAGFEFKLEGAVASDLSGSENETSSDEKKGTLVTTYIAPGLGDQQNLAIKYLGTNKGKEPAIKSYDGDSGKLEFTVYHFSRYAIVSSKAVAADNNGTIYSVDTTNTSDTTALKATLAAVGNNDVTTITLLKDIELTESLTFTQEVLTIDLNSHKITFKDECNLAISNGTKLDIKNGTFVYTGDNTAKNIISNSGTLNMTNLTVDADITADANVSLTSVATAVADDNSCPQIALLINNGTATLDNSKLYLDVKLGEGKNLVDTTNSKFAGAKPLIVYQGAGSTTTIQNGSELKGSTNVPGGILGLYILVFDNSANNADAKISGSTIDISNSSYGWTRPVFAESRSSNAKATVSITGSTIKSTDTFTDTEVNVPKESEGTTEMTFYASKNLVYGLRAKGNSIIYVDNSTTVKVTQGGGQKITYAGEVGTHSQDSATNVCGKIINNVTGEAITIEIGSNGDDYASYANAIKYAPDGSTIKVVGDVDLKNETQLDIEKKSIKIDFNNHTLTVKKRIRVKGAKLTLSGTGALETSKDTDGNYGDNSVIWVYGSTTNQEDFTVLTVGEGITITGQKGIALVSLESDEGYKATKGSSYGIVVKLNGTTINATECGIYTNGLSNGTKGNVPVFNLDNVKINQARVGDKKANWDYAGIYAAGYAVWNIKNTTINSTDALSLKSGIVTIDGGTYTSTGEFADPSVDTSNASVNTGAALSMTSNDNYAKELKVTVNSGKFISSNGYAIYEGIPNKKDNDGRVATSSYVTLEVNGGEFVGNSEKGAVKLSEMAKKKVLKGGVYSSEPKDYIADGYKAEQDGTNWKVTSSAT